LTEDLQKGSQSHQAPEIHTCKISRILTNNDEGNYDIANDALSSQTILQGIKQYVKQYDMLSIIKIPQGISAKKFTPTNITPSTKWLSAIDDYDQIDDYQYAAW
jgi:hypothetical protein